MLYWLCLGLHCYTGSRLRQLLLFQSTGSRALQASAAGAHGPSCFLACGRFPRARHGTPVSCIDRHTSPLSRQGSPKPMDFRVCTPNHSRALAWVTCVYSYTLSHVRTWVTSFCACTHTHSRALACPRSETGTLVLTNSHSGPHSHIHVFTFTPSHTLKYTQLHPHTHVHLTHSFTQGYAGTSLNHLMRGYC